MPKVRYSILLTIEQEEKDHIIDVYRRNYKVNRTQRFLNFIRGDVKQLEKEEREKPE